MYTLLMSFLDDILDKSKNTIVTVKHTAVQYKEAEDPREHQANNTISMFSLSYWLTCIYLFTGT